jgi:hypothetical protein
MRLTDNQRTFLKDKQIFYLKHRKNLIAPIFNGFIELLLELDRRA